MRAAEEGTVEIVFPAVEVKVPGELKAEAGVPGLVVIRPGRSMHKEAVGEVEDEAPFGLAATLLGKAPRPLGEQGAAGDPYMLQSCEPLTLK